VGIQVAEDQAEKGDQVMGSFLYGWHCPICKARNSHFIDTCANCGFTENFENNGEVGTNPDKVDHPAHYGGDTTYEAIKVIEAWDLNFNLGSALKYISRAGKKPGEDELDDLNKAKWYVAREIERRVAQRDGAGVEKG
jgi:hypothetical protein